jgi:transposase
MAYSEDLKQRVLAFVTAGASKVEAARVFCLARATVYVWLGQPPDHQRGKPGPKTGHKIDRAKLAQLIEEQPDLLQREMAQIMGASRNGISRTLKVMGVTRKKTLRYAQAFTPKAVRKRKKYLLRHWRAHTKGCPLVYLTASNSRPPASSALIPGAQTDRSHVLYGHVQHTGSSTRGLSTRCCPDTVTGRVIVLDNASFDKSPQTRQLTQQTGGQLLYLAPCSPDFNPIEKL